MQFNRLLYAFLILFISCKGDAQKNTSAEEIPSVNNHSYKANFPDESKQDNTTDHNQTLSGLYTLDSAKISLNNNSFKVVVLEKTEKKNQENPQHNSLPVVIKKQDGNVYAKNDQIIFKYNDNCPADGFQRLVAKGNFFTVEQTYCKDFMFVNSYTTFRLNENNEIVLFKYGEEYTDRSNPDKDIKGLIKTTKDFGRINFNDVNEKLLLHFFRQ